MKDCKNDRSMAISKLKLLKRINF